MSHDTSWKASILVSIFTSRFMHIELGFKLLIIYGLVHTSLHEPITQILGDEWYLDVDPDKALGRFTQEEIINQ